MECLLASNHRAAKWTCAVLCVLGLLALGVGIAAYVWWFRLLAILAGAACFLICTSVFVAMRKPRVAYADGHLCLNLGAAAPFCPPLDVVECFFLGQGPSFVGKGPVAEAEASNVVVRLAERATDWHKRDVRPSLGNWCDGYITIRGAWCEPIDGQVVEKMNSRLAAVKRERKEAAKVQESQEAKTR